MRCVNASESGKFVTVKNKLTSVFHMSLLSLNIVKVVYGFTRLSPRGSTATFIDNAMTKFMINNKPDT